MDMENMIHRPRRLRRTPLLRSLVRETRLSPADFIYPLFVCSGEGVRREVRSMPGVFNLSIDELIKEVIDAKTLGISSFMIFGLPDEKDAFGSKAFAEEGITQEAVVSSKMKMFRMIRRST